MQSPIDHGYRPECECSGCKATARICAELNNEEAEIFADGYNAAMQSFGNSEQLNSPVTPDGWISCSDLMPEDTKMLLAFSQGEIVAAYWNWVVNPIDYKKYRAFTYLSGNILDDVTHWMPLPEPPL
ncbi:DUF551 domain-containing protein [Salmonella enterica subsp. enterica serovar Rubislaw]|nr:DUF551 domain-containing protein [Salmonella enterica subsp. enterica serovar Rubislaw]